MIKKRRAAHHVFMTRTQVRAALRAYKQKVYLDRLVASFLDKPPEYYQEFITQTWGVTDD